MRSALLFVALIVKVACEDTKAATKFVGVDGERRDAVGTNICFSLLTVHFEKFFCSLLIDVC
jgi:hypothetical protein